MSMNYLFQAAPKPVQTRSKKHLYREQEESKEATAKAANIMYDRRVSRGSTYAPSKRTQPLPHASFRPVHPPAGQSQPRTRSSLGSAAKQHPLPQSAQVGGVGGAMMHGVGGDGGVGGPAGDVDFIRIATPEPVAGRVHTQIQTDTYLEDLRRPRAGAGQEFATQTDAENDRPTEPLFTPQSSGDDVATEIEPQALFDFELEVQAVLGVLVEKSLEQALMEVLEEEEMAQLAAHQAAFQQEKNTQLHAVQQLVRRDERRMAERERRAEQEKARIAAEADASAKRHAALVSKQLVARMEENILEKLEASGAFYDPVRKEVETVFMPALMAATSRRLQQHQVAVDALDALLVDSINEYRAEVAAQGLEADEAKVAALVKYMLAPDSEKGPRPREGIRALADKVGRAEEDLARRAVQLSAASAASFAAASASAGRNTALPLTPEQRAAAIVADIREKREAARRAEEQHKKDIIRIQALARGKRDRERVEKIAAKRRLQAERAAMSPQELLASLSNHLGFTVGLTRPTSASSSSSAAPGPEIWTVKSIEPAGPASQAGLVLGDHILSFASKPLDASTADLLLNPDSLKRSPFALNPGDQLPLEVVRRTTDGRTETVHVEIASGEEGYTNQEIIRGLRADAELPPLPSPSVPWLDADSAREALEALGNGKLGANLGELPRGGGARVAKVGSPPDSAAARAHFTEGDVIVSVNGSPLSDSKALSAVLKESLPGDILELDMLAPSAVEKLAAAGAEGKVNLKSLQTVRRHVELGGGAKKMSIEQVRSLRRIAGLPVFGEEETTQQQ